MTGILLDAYRYVPPSAASFTHTYATNSQSPTLTDTSHRGMVMDFGTTPASGNNIRAFTKDKTVLTTTYDIILRQQPSTSGFNFWLSGICVSDGTKFVTFGMGGANSINGGAGFKVDQWTNNTTFSAEPLATNPTWCYEWMKVGVVSGAVTNFDISANGTDFVRIFSSSQSAFLTYTQVGIFQLVNRNTGSLPVSGTNQISSSIMYFSDPDIVPSV